MTAMNIVRVRPKPGRAEEFLTRQRDREALPGMLGLRVVDVGKGEYVIVGEWESMDALARARPAMIAILDAFRDTLEDLGGGLGVTDARSGEVKVSEG